MKIRLDKKPPLVKNLLLIEGPTRAGKFLLANILSGFKDMEPIQYSPLAEQIPLWTELGLIDKEAAIEFLKVEIDTRCYDMLNGRNLNHRIWDKSSIFNIPNYQKFLARSKEKNITKIVEQFYKEKPYQPFIMHELMPHISIYFKAFPELRVISIRRDPLDLAFSWYKRKAGRRYGIDPIIGRIPIIGKYGSAPWFLPQWNQLSEMDRIILSISNFFKMYAKAYRRLPKKSQKNILLVSYEDILSDTKNVIKTIGDFLNKKPLFEMKLILKREKLPAFEARLTRSQKLEEIKKTASKKYFNALLKLEKEYGQN